MLADGTACDKDELFVEVTHPGRGLDFSLTSFNVPIATHRLALAIASIGAANVQRLSVRIAGQSAFDVMNSTRVVNCLDEEKSEFIKWTQNDHRADLAGQYRQVTRLCLAPGRIPIDADFFRVDGWRVALIVSDSLRAEMERVGCVGAKFQSVSHC
jgi:hypothetical protein